MGAEEIPEQGRRAMLETFGCHRPDKRHLMTEERAQEWMKAQHRPGDVGQEVYHCCAAGWVFGRRRVPPGHRTG